MYLVFCDPLFTSLVSVHLLFYMLQFGFGMTALHQSDPFGFLCVSYGHVLGQMGPDILILWSIFGKASFLALWMGIGIVPLAENS